MEERESDILIAEPEEEFEENYSNDYQNEYNSKEKTFEDNSSFDDEYNNKPAENQTIKKEAKTFTNYNFNNLNKVYKKYDVIETYVPKKQSKQNKNKQFEKFVDEQNSFSPERETIVVEKVEKSHNFHQNQKQELGLFQS